MSFLTQKENNIDLHRKAIVVDMVNSSRIDSAYLKKMQDSGITASNVSVDVYKVSSFHEVRRFGFREYAKKVVDWLHTLDDNRDKAFLATSVDDVMRAKKEKKLAIVFAFHTAGGIENDPSLLTIFHRLGVRVIQITFNDRNLLGDGCTERTDCGLSNFGLQVVEDMNRLGMVIDLSHTGYTTSMETIQFSKEPVIMSHANSRTLCDVERNKTDEEIKALAEKGGVIGVTPYALMVKRERRPTLEDYLDHIDYLVKLVGPNHIGIGSDLAEGRWGSDGKEPWLFGPKGLPEYRRMTQKLTWLTPKTEFADGFSSILHFPNVTKGLVARGYSDQEIEKILGKNILRLYKTVWKK